MLGRLCTRIMFIIRRYIPTFLAVRAVPKLTLMLMLISSGSTTTKPFIQQERTRAHVDDEEIMDTFHEMDQHGGEDRHDKQRTLPALLPLPKRLHLQTL